MILKKVVGMADVEGVDIDDLPLLLIFNSALLIKEVPDLRKPMRKFSEICWFPPVGRLAGNSSLIWKWWQMSLCGVRL